MGKKVEVVVCGLGPSGISVVDLITSEYPDSLNLTIVDPFIEPEAARKVFAGETNNSNESSERQKIKNALRRSKKTSSFHKSSLLIREGSSISNSFFWGASCLPLSAADLSEFGISSSDFYYQYSAVNRIFGVGTFLDDEVTAQDPPILGEYSHEIDEKILAKRIRRGNTQFRPTRLAIETRQSFDRSCKLKGTCFDDCEVSAPWTPTLGRLNASKKARTIRNSVKSIDIDNKFIVLHGEQHVEYDLLILATGTINTGKLLSASGLEEVTFEVGRVELSPAFFFRQHGKKDFAEHLTFSDLLLPYYDKHGRQQGLTQIYLPSTEIAGRIMGLLPQVLGDSVLQMIPTFLFRRIGVYMTFARTGLTSEAHVLRKIRTFNLVQSMKRGILLVPWYRKKLPEGSSYHFGAIHHRGEIFRGFRSVLFESLRSKGVLLADTSILPFIPAGPITSSSAALARVIVKKALDGVLHV